MKNFELESNGSDLALTASGKRSFQGRPWDRNRGCFQAKQKGMTPPDSYVKRNIEFDYCGKLGHLAKDCYRRKNHESNQRHRRHNGNFINRDTSVIDGFKNLKLFLSDAALSTETNDENSWFIDSGASAHMTCSKEWYDKYYEKTDGTHIYLGYDRSLKVQGYGIINVYLPNGQMRQIHNVMYVPDLKKNLIFVSTITDNHLKVEFGKLGCIVKDVQDHYKVVSTGTRVGGLYRLDVIVKRHVALTSKETSTTKLWNHRYGHLNYNDLSLLQKKING